MLINSKYQEVLQDLNLGKRVWLTLEDELRAEILKVLSAKSDIPSIFKAFCILSYLRKPDLAFEQDILSFLESYLPNMPESKLAAVVQVLQTQVIQSHQIKGIRYKGNFLVLLKNLFKFTSDESSLLLLETIDQLGAQKLFFKKDVEEIFTRIKIWQQLFPKKNAIKILSIRLLKEMQKIMVFSPLNNS
jgi:hypothetical protein